MLLGGVVGLWGSGMPPRPLPPRPVWVLLGPSPSPRRPPRPRSVLRPPAAELGRVRPRAADTPALTTIYVAGVSRDVRQHRLRGLQADVAGVHAHAVVDADRFGATTAVTVVAAEAEAFRAAVGRGRAATVLRLLVAGIPGNVRGDGARARRLAGHCAVPQRDGRPLRDMPAAEHADLCQ